MMTSETQTEWSRLLEDAVNWLPGSIRLQVQEEDDPSNWMNPVEASYFLKLIMCIKEANLSSALDLIDQLYDTLQSAEYVGALFLLRARVHFLLGEYEDMMSCLKHAADLNEDPAQVQQTMAELAALLSRVTGQCGDLGSNVELNAECLPEPTDQRQIQIDSASERVPSAKVGNRHYLDDDAQVVETKVNFEGPETLCQTTINRIGGLLSAAAGPERAKSDPSGHLVTEFAIYNFEDYNPYNRIFEPLVRKIAEQIESNGGSVTSCTGPLREGRKRCIDILVGAHVLPPEQLRALESGLNVINLEQIDSTGWENSAYKNFVLRSSAADWSDLHSQKYGFNKLQLPRLSDEPSQLGGEHKVIDVLFIGSMNLSRQNFLADLKNLGLKVENFCGVFGHDLFRLVEKSYVVLNMPYYNFSQFEEYRFALMAGCGAVFHSLTSPEAAPRHFAKAPHIFVESAESLLERVNRYKENEDERLACLEAETAVLNLMNDNFETTLHDWLSFRNN